MKSWLLSDNQSLSCPDFLVKSELLPSFGKVQEVAGPEISKKCSRVELTSLNGVHSSVFHFYHIVNQDIG